MTAGAGILHIEAPPEELVVSGGLFHGIQLWVNLPSANKWNPPRYQDIRGREAALLTTGDGGALIRLIAGDLGGQVGPGSTFTPITMVHATISPGARRTAALARGLQRSCLCAGWQRHCRHGPQAGPHRPARGVRTGRRPHDHGRSEPSRGWELRGPAARRPSDRRACRCTTARS